ncbi:hypothetical protein B2J93_4693 [Marssonina coronariae]|uniref:Uncharacterized protein n=1 Tax=Diplocarpon coronariae TaxID=2795749 RepID=A0A218Z2S6_9HELO|nr:hypothetical protein B2J93_4693 [Marssonina coronariae]
MSPMSWMLARARTGARSHPPGLAGQPIKEFEVWMSVEDRQREVETERPSAPRHVQQCLAERRTFGDFSGPENLHMFPTPPEPPRALLPRAWPVLRSILPRSSPPADPLDISTSLPLALSTSSLFGAAEAEPQPDSPRDESIHTIPPPLSWESLAEHTHASWLSPAAQAIRFLDQISNAPAGAGVSSPHATQPAGLAESARAAITPRPHIDGRSGKPHPALKFTSEDAYSRMYGVHGESLDEVKQFFPGIVVRLEKPPKSPGALVTFSTAILWLEVKGSSDPKDHGTARQRSCRISGTSTTPIGSSSTALAPALAAICRPLPARGIPRQLVGSSRAEPGRGTLSLRVQAVEVTADVDVEEIVVASPDYWEIKLLDYKEKLLQQM